MLSHLHINSLAIIDHVQIEFCESFNVITGETGAGKSILIKALHLLLGGKSKADVVRDGAKQAVITGNFNIASNHQALSILDSIGVPYEESQGHVVLIIRRSVSAKGRSLAWINDTPVTLASLKDCAKHLMDIFAQHDNFKLLEEHRHTAHLDQFLSTAKNLQATKNTHKECLHILDEIKSLLTHYCDKQESRDYLEYRYTELQKFAPSVEEFQDLSLQCRENELLIQQRDTVLRAHRHIEPDSQSHSVSAHLWSSVRELQDIKQPSKEMTTLLEEGQELATRLDDWNFELGQVANNYAISDDQWEATQERLASYQSLMRRFQVDEVRDLMSKMEELEKDLNFLDEAINTIGSLSNKLHDLCLKLAKHAKKLSVDRKEAATTLSKKIQNEFASLSMPKGRMEVEFSSYQGQKMDLNLSCLGAKWLQEWQSTWDVIGEVMEHTKSSGLEKANFMLSTNAGENLKPLNRVASGGEISRIMLALKKVLLDEAKGCVLVFDEIDTGISGSVADKVGRKISELSRSTQIICISHLPQVAAYANQHIKIQKLGAKSRTKVDASQLNQHQSTEEIARLLSGALITDDSLANAKSLISRRMQLDHSLKIN